jgi:DNA-binding response OmpR family regulator
MDKNKNLKCIIVDDDKVFLIYLKILFELNGFDVTDCTNVHDTLEILKKEKFDLIISDIDMPDKNGFDLVSSIKSNVQTNQIPFLFVSNLDDNQTICNAFKLGAVGFIKKPFLKHHIPKILALLDGKNPKLISVERG